MINLANSSEIHQFRVLLSSAITLKESFDKNEGIEIIRGKFGLLLKDVEYLKKLIPIDLIEQGELLRHIAWIEKWLSKNEPDRCYGDIEQICAKDLFTVEDHFFNYLAIGKKNSSSEVNILNQQLLALKMNDCEASAWLLTTERLLKRLFPNDVINLSKLRHLSNQYNFSGTEKARFQQLIEGYIKEMETKSNSGEDYNKWSTIHAIIVRVSKSRFESTHYADAVEAAFKEINDIIKQAYKKKTGQEEDGDSLMRRAFSANKPIFRFNDNSTESETNIQQGYMEIFAGSIKGIRNPKAHANLNIHPDEAWEKIVLSSHLMKMWDKTSIYEQSLTSK